MTLPSLTPPPSKGDGVVRIRLGTPPAVEQQVVIPAEQCILPRQVARGPDGRFYLVCEGRYGATRSEPGSVLALDPDTLAVVARFAVGLFPDAITFVGAQR